MLIRYIVYTYDTMDSEIRSSNKKIKKSKNARSLFRKNEKKKLKKQVNTYTT